MSTQSVNDLIGEDTSFDDLGPDMTGDLTTGYIPGRAIVYVPQTTIGDGLAGPLNEQQLAIYRDDRVIASDELGRQGPFQMTRGAIARNRAGRTFPLNMNWNEGLDPGLVERVPEQDVLHPSVFGDANDVYLFDGVPSAEILPPTNTVIYTTSPDVGFTGY